MLASFLTPALFYTGLGAASVPIIIHILARRRFKKIRWAAMEFLLQAERRNRRRLRLEEWLLLALRCLAVGLVGALLARPFLSPAGASWAGTKRTERVFVLDDSLSMAYEGADGSPFARAKSAVRTLIELIRREYPDDTVTLIRMTAPDKPVDAGTYLDDAQTDALLTRLEGISVTQRSNDPAITMSTVSEVLARNSDTLSAVVYILSDFQRSEWSNPIDGGTVDSRSILAPLSNWTEKGKSLEVVLVNVGDQAAMNSAISAVTMSGGPAVAGAESTIRARVQNFSDRSLEQVGIDVSVGSVVQPTKVVPSIPPGSPTDVEMGAEFIRTGDEFVRVSIPSDGLPQDDTRVFVAEVASAVRVLMVNGEPSADGFADETTFLTTALRPEGEVFSGNEVHLADETQLESTDLATYHAVVLANVYRPSETAVAALEKFARDGGGVMVFAGDQVDPVVYNNQLFRDGAGLLPCRLTELIRVEDGASINIVDRTHPALRGLARGGDALGMGSVPFFQFVGCETTTSGAGEAGSPRPTNGRVLAVFEGEAKTPAIVERTMGEGKVLWVGTSADKEWHLWPDHPTFLPVMMELVRYVARSGSNKSDFVVGAPLSLPFDPSQYEPQAKLRSPNFPTEAETVISPTVVDGGASQELRTLPAESAGVYQFALRRLDGTEQLKLIAVNVDPRESNLTPSTEADLRKALGKTPFRYVGDVRQLANMASESAVEFWRGALFVLIALLMLEQGLAWFWGRKK